jgi:hypothetical protein
MHEALGSIPINAKRKQTKKKVRKIWWKGLGIIWPEVKCA